MSLIFKVILLSCVGKVYWLLILHPCLCVVILQGSREAVLWLAAHHKDKNALGVLSREIAPAGTGMGRLIFDHLSFKV